MRVFEVSVTRGGAIYAVAVDLPTGWARSHMRVDVLLSQDELGWYAHLVGNDDEHLLGFPWHDHVDEILLARDARSLPIDLTAGSWDDVEQGWWATVIPAGSRAYLAEANFDELVDNVVAGSITRKQPGVVTVDGVDVRWNCFSRAGYDEAWSRAIASLPREQGDRLARRPSASREAGRRARRLREPRRR